jgi:hypothetical protein
MGETTARRAFDSFCENKVTHFYDAYVTKRPKVEESYGGIW